MKLLEELSRSIDSRVINHRNNFYKLIYNRYLSLLPTLVKYNVGNTYTYNVNIDFYKMERVLRYYGNAVIGVDKQGTLVLLGYKKDCNTDLLFEDMENISIKFLNDVIPQDSYRVISNIDNYKTGNCIVIYNKLYNNDSDIHILDYYCQELAELNMSRFSLILQSKINTIFSGDVGDETINELVTKIYNGSPFIKVGKNFDVEEQIIKIDNKSAELLEALKTEYNNKLSEFNNILGINTTYKDKTSGVSESELNGNEDFIYNNAEIYILSRNSALLKLYKRWGIKIIASYREKEVKEDEENGNDN